MLPMPFAPARWNGETAPTVHTRSSRPCESRLICTASSTTCRKITPASSTSDLCREGMPAIVLRSSFRFEGFSCKRPEVCDLRLSPDTKNLQLITNYCFSVDANLPQQPEIAQHLSRTQHYGSQWIVRNRHR